VLDVALLAVNATNVKIILGAGESQQLNNIYRYVANFRTSQGKERRNLGSGENTRKSYD
jgi:vancomycin permeability regulator SanA